MGRHWATASSLESNITDDLNALRAAYRLHKVWAGMAFEGSGALLWGKQSYAGVIYSLWDPVESVRYGHVWSESESIGLKLGGSLAGHLLVAWGFNQASDIDLGDAGSFDWALDFALFRGESVAKGLKRVKYLSKIGDFAENYSKLLKDLDFLVNNEKALLNPSRPNLVAIPFLSAGLKVGVGIKASIVKGEDMGLIDFTDSSAVLAHLTAL